MSNSYDAIVIGAGIIGSGIALALARGGRKVLALDKNPAAGYGSTSSSSAIIRTFYSTRASCALAWEGLHVWRHWQDFLEADDDEVITRLFPCTALVTRNDEADGMETILSHHDALGIPYEILSTADLKTHWPALDLASYTPPRRPEDEEFGTPSGKKLDGAIMFPMGGYVPDPQLAARNMQNAAERHGATFRFGVRVSGIQSTGDRVSGVSLETGELITAPIIVNAAGPYSNQINRMAGVLEDMNLTTRPLRQEVCHLPGPDGFTNQLIMCDADTGAYWRTELSGSLLVGGMEPECDPLEWVDDPDDFERNPTELWTAHVYRAALRLPSLGIPNQASGLADLYDVTEDWTPIYDISCLPGFYLAVGTSGNQFKNGPVAGELMAALINWQEAGHDHDKNPCSITLNRTGETLDLSAFSRRRTPNTSSDNVLG